ncbi:MAG: ATP-binding protein, partial [Pseudomonadota bacterium]
GGSVTVSIDQTDDKNLVLTVTDTGIGIPGDKIPFLFDKFSKASQKGTSGEKGTGLGLAITKELVEQHGGTIEVTSKTGKGACFKVIFPMSKAKKEAKG